MVYVPSECVSCSSVFQTWLNGPVLKGLLNGAGEAMILRVQTRLKELADLLLWPTLAHSSRQGDVACGVEATTQVMNKVSSSIRAVRTLRNLPMR